jgi:molecular chaperone IbpA
MNAYDLAPLFRSGVGFDRLARLAESASRMAEPSTSYPPYNIERLSAPEDQGERGDAYAITVAVAGFAESDLSVDVEGQTLTITGHKERADKQEDTRVRQRHRHRCRPERWPAHGVPETGGPRSRQATAYRHR